MVHVYNTCRKIKLPVLRTKAVWILLLSCIGLSSCLNFNSKKSARRDQPVLGFTQAFFMQNPFANNTNLANNLSQSLSQLAVDRNLNPETLWALAACQCSPNLSGQYTRALVESRGAVPQPLVPNIRETIRNKPILKNISALGPLSNLLGFFAKDATIDKEIKKGLSEKISNSLPSGSKVADQLPILFDLFPSPYLHLGEGSGSFPPKTFDVSEQASKWAFVMGLEPMWRGQFESVAPIGYTDHGLQLLATALSVSEWSYAFGLDPTTSGVVYGGLTIDPKRGMRSPIGPFDPRKNPSGSGILSGKYTVQYASASNINLALSAKEQWQRTGDILSLDEQARVWTAAATAYERMRPSGRSGDAQQLFSPKALFPDDVHLLPLAFLPGIASLLDGPFIDAKNFIIYEYANVPDATAPQVNQRATLKSMTRLTRALLLWNLAIESSNADRLPAAVAKQIDASKSKLKDSLRLSVQTILDQYVMSNMPGSRLNSIGLTVDLKQPRIPNIADAAEALTVLALADQSLFKNDYTQTDFQKKLIGLFHWFAAEYLSNIASGKQTFDSPQAAVWVLTAMRVFIAYKPELTHAIWKDDLARNIELAIANWDNNGKAPSP